MVSILTDAECVLASSLTARFVAMVTNAFHAEANIDTVAILAWNLYLYKFFDRASPDSCLSGALSLFVCKGLFADWFLFSKHFAQHKRVLRSMLHTSINEIHSMVLLRSVMATFVAGLDAVANRKPMQTRFAWMHVSTEIEVA